MCWKHVVAKMPDNPRRRAMTTRLTLYYAVSIFSLLGASSGFMYWGLKANLEQGNREYLQQKMRVLTQILDVQPLNLAGVEQEVREEAEISAQSQSPFFLRVLDSNNRLLVETADMTRVLPVAAFPDPLASAAVQRAWQADGIDFLLASAEVPARTAAFSHWRVQAAINTRSEHALLSRYRRNIVIVMSAGTLLAIFFGLVITRRGLRPIADITRAAQRIGVLQLRERINTGAWPEELATLATAFDEMLDRLQEAFERLTQFSADLAHELRTPINNLLGEAQVALSRARSAPEYTRLLQSALEEYRRLARMIDSMLFLAQADQAHAGLDRVSLDARVELQAVADFYQALADERDVRLSCQGGGTVIADQLLLRRALSNLLSNAIKYTPRGGVVTLQAGPHMGGARLSVSDTGVGIASEHIPKLGDRFYRIDAARADSASGSGLGLAIVRSIMTLHGGRLRFESAEGVGTAVFMEFLETESSAPAPG
jgi:two-component system heavy metal sensor histidine kinase CusS